jgi:hypothetical protein
VHGAAARELRRHQLEPVLVLSKESGDDRSRIEMSLDIQETLLQDTPRLDSYIVASGDSDLHPIFRRLREAGRKVTLASLRQAASRDMARSAGNVVWMDDLLSLNEETESEINFEEHDWTPFIELLVSLEGNLEFVGMNYLIRRVMDRTNCGHSDLRRKQDIINYAQNTEMIEVYQVDNKEEGGDPVSACRLRRDHPVVQRVLEAE